MYRPFIRTKILHQINYQKKKTMCIIFQLFRKIMNSSLSVAASIRCRCVATVESASNGLTRRSTICVSRFPAKKGEIYDFSRGHVEIIVV